MHMSELDATYEENRRARLREDQVGWWLGEDVLAIQCDGPQAFFEYCMAKMFDHSQEISELVSDCDCATLRVPWSTVFKAIEATTLTEDTIDQRVLLIGDMGRRSQARHPSLGYRVSVEVVGHILGFQCQPAFKAHYTGSHSP